MAIVTKVVKPSEMVRLEKSAYTQSRSSESALSLEEIFMENAGSIVADVVQRAIAKYHLKPKIILLCGKGNNAGDAYVAGRLLLSGQFDVSALSLVPLEKTSPLCKLQGSRFLAAGGKIKVIHDAEMIDFGDGTLLVDGIYGTGFKGTVSGLSADLITRANASKLPIIAIDIPSGIDGETGESALAIKATETVFLGLPKSGCFVGKAWNLVGKVNVFDFGLGKERIEEAVEDFYLIEEKEIQDNLPAIERTRHKYERGYVVGLAGSFGMPGAALLSGFAALRAGAGIVRILHPQGMEGEFAGAPPELIREGYRDAFEVLKAMERASALFIGPGIGTSPSALEILKAILKQTSKPCVIDAEALTLIGKEKLMLPEGAILTPHRGEMKRLLNLERELSPWEEIGQVQEFSEKNGVTVVLKGSPTFIFHPKSKPWISTRGDPGMATAGCGDVLTGIIAALLSQKKSPLESAKMGVYLHGMAGELAAEKSSSYSMVASDVTEALADVFKHLQR